MEEDTSLVCRKIGKTGEDSNPAKFNEYLVLISPFALSRFTCMIH